MHVLTLHPVITTTVIATITGFLVGAAGFAALRILTDGCDTSGED